MKNLNKAFKVWSISTIVLNATFIGLFIGLLYQVVPVIINSVISKETWVGPVRFIVLAIALLISIKIYIFSILNINNALYFTTKWGIKNQKFSLAKMLMCIDAVFNIIVSARLIAAEVKVYGLSDPLFVLPCSVVVILSIISIAYTIMSKKQYMEENNVRRFSKQS